MRVRFAVHVVVAAVVFAGGTAMACQNPGGTPRPLLAASAVGSRSGSVDIPKTFDWTGDATIRPKGSWGGFELIDKAGRLRAWGIVDKTLGLQITGGDDFMEMEWSSAAFTPLPVPPGTIVRRTLSRGSNDQVGSGFPASIDSRPGLPAGHYTFSVLGDGATSVVMSARTTARLEHPVLVHHVGDAVTVSAVGTTPGDAPAAIVRATLSVPHTYHLVLHVITSSHDLIDAGGYDNQCMTAVGGYCESDPNWGPVMPTVNDPTWWVGGGADFPTIGRWGPGDLAAGRYDAVAERAEVAADTHLAELAAVLP